MNPKGMLLCLWIIAVTSKVPDEWNSPSPNAIQQRSWDKPVASHGPTSFQDTGESLPLQTGLVFIPMDDFSVANAAWKIYIQVSYDPLCTHVAEAQTAIRTKVNKFLGLVQHDTEKKGWGTYFSHTLQSYAKIFQLCTSIADLHGSSRKQSTRQKRALLDVGGQLLEELFGVSTDKELEDVQNELRAVESAVRNYSNVEKKQITIINDTWIQMNEQKDRVDKLVEGFESLREADGALETQLMAVNENERNILHELLAAKIVISATTLTQELERQVTGMENVLLAAATNLLHPDLLDPAKLKQKLLEIEELLPNQFELLFPPAKAYFYYQEKILTTFSTQTGFSFLIKIPLRNQNSGFHLLATKPVPVPLQNSSLFAYIHSVPSYFAVSQDKQSFIEMEHSDVLLCTDGPVRLCPVISAIRHRDSQTCLAALYYGRQDEIHNLCPRMITRSPAATAIRIPYTNEWYISLSSTTRLQLSCLTSKSQPTLSTDTYAAGTYRFTVPNQCTIKGPLFNLPIQLSGSTHISWTNFNPSDDIPEVKNLFSKEDLQFLSENPNTTLQDIHRSSPSILHRIFNDTLHQYGNRPADLDHLRAQILTTDRNLFSNPAHFAHHFTRPSMWIPVLTTLGVLSFLYAGAKAVIWARSHWKSRRAPIPVPVPIQLSTRAVELEPLSPLTQSATPQTLQMSPF